MSYSVNAGKKHHFTTTATGIDVMASNAKINEEFLGKIKIFLTVNNASQEDIDFVSRQVEILKTLETTDAFGVTEEYMTHFSENVGTAVTSVAVKSYTICAQHEPRADKSRSLHIFMGISNKGSRKTFLTASLDDLNKTSDVSIKDIKYKQPKGLRILQVWILSTIFYKI